MVICNYFEQIETGLIKVKSGEKHDRIYKKRLKYDNAPYTKNGVSDFDQKSYFEPSSEYRNACRECLGQFKPVFGWKLHFGEHFTSFDSFVFVGSSLLGFLRLGSKERLETI